MVYYIDIQNVSVYKKAFAASNSVWSEVIRWQAFAKNTMGSQFVDATDSISANIAEGFGRYHKKDKIKFYHYALGSVSEAVDWNNKAVCRGLISSQKHAALKELLTAIPHEIRMLIHITNQKLSI